MTKLLRLHALDAEDLAIFSANLQDALIAVGDMTYLPRAKRFALVGDRFDWVRAAGGVCERRRAGLHFEFVTKVARIGFEQTRHDVVLNLLSVTFEPGAAAPAGQVLMTFSGGAALRLDVECLDAQLRDLGPAWKAATEPAHQVDAAD